MRPCLIALVMAAAFGEAASAQWVTECVHHTSRLVTCTTRRSPSPARPRATGEAVPPRDTLSLPERHLLDLRLLEALRALGSSDTSAPRRPVPTPEDPKDPKDRHRPGAERPSPPGATAEAAASFTQ